MKLFVIYDHPKDYPNGFVCVLWKLEKRIKVVGYADDLDGARGFIPPGRVNIGRFKNDDPAICEVWI